MKACFRPLFWIFLGLLAPQAYAEPNIVIEGRANTGGVITWPDISDGDLVPNQDVTQFGTQFCNEFIDRTYRIRNSGNETLTVFINTNSPSSTSSQFSFLGLPSSHFTLGAGANEEFTIRYRPLTQGARETTIRIDSNDPDAESTYSFAVTGNGRCGEASVAFNPATGSDVGIADGDTTPSATSGTDFGILPVGNSTTRDFYIRNSSSAPDVLRIRNPQITGSGASHFQILSLGTSNLGIGSNRDFQIRFAPTSAGIKTATFTFENNDATDGENPYSFTLSGEGTAFPEIAVEGKRDQFGTTFDVISDGQSVPNSANGTLFDNTAVGSSRDSIIRIKNTGNAILTLGERTITGTGAESFVLVAGFTTTNVLPGEESEFYLRFSPVAAGTQTATLSFGNNDSNENPFNFIIQGVGEAPEIRISGRRIVGLGTYDNIIDGETTVRESEGTDFGSVRVSSGSNTSQFKITNDGNAGLNLSNPRIIGSGESHFSFSGVNSAFNIAAGNDREFTITFNPTTLGTKVATFLVDSNDPDEATYSFALQGVSFGLPEIRVQGRRDVIGTFLTEIVSGDSTPISNDGTLFANTAVGSTYDMLVRVHNDGDDVLSLGSRSFTGPDANQFNTAGFPTGGSIAAGGSVDFNIRFTPTSFGTKTATFSFGNGDSNENPFSFAIQGHAEAPEIQLAGHLPGQPFVDVNDGDTTPSVTDGTDFGETNVTGTGNEAQREFRITNSGNANLNIENGTTITGPAASDYTISGLFAGNPFVNIGERQNQTFVITFNPSNTGVRNATLSIANNDPDEDPYTVALTGIGIGRPEIRVQGRREIIGTFLTEISDGDTSPRSEDGTLFASTKVGETYSMLVRVHNDGDGEMNFGSRSITGTNADQFNTVGFPTNGTLAPNASVDFRVRFTPTSFGTKNAVLSFGNDDGNENPFNFAIRGTAVAPEMEVRGGGSTFSIPIEDGDSTPQTADGTLFGEVNPNGGSLVVPFRIINLGNDTLTIDDKSVTGTNASDFIIRNLPTNPLNTNIEGGLFVDFEVEFNPSAAGARHATIVLHNNDSDEAPYTFAVSGIGQDPGLLPEIRVSSNSGNLTISNGDTTPRADDGTDFGSPTVGDADITRTFIIHNDGDADLEIYGLTVNNTLYSNTTPATIAAGQQRTFDVTLSLSDSGVQAGIVSIFNNDTSASSYTFAITADVQSADGSLEITAFVKDGSDASITFTSIPGHSYSIKKSTNLQVGSWAPVPGYENIAGSASPQTINLMNVIDPISEPKAFFRLEKNNPY